MPFTTEIFIFVNVGLVETINRAAGALQKDQNGADVPQPDWYVRNIGAARAFNGGINIGGGGNWTTAEFITWLENQGAFNHPYWMCKGAWSYANNRIITDTGCGNIQLAGAVIEVMGHRGAMTIRVTTATAGAGTLSSQFTYTNHGDDYSPGWRRDLKRSGDTMSGELKIPRANALRIFNAQFGLIFRRSEESLHLIPTLENQGENGNIGPLRPLSINLRTGEVMIQHKLLAIGGAQISSSLGIGVDNALGENSIVLGDSDTGFKQNGDGILDVYANSVHVFRFLPGSIESGVPLKVSGVEVATQAWVSQNFVQNIRQSGVVYIDAEKNSGQRLVPAGGVLIGSQVNGEWDNNEGFYYTWIQQNINGNWLTIGRV